MTIDLMVWASTREQFIKGMVENGLATYEDDILTPTDGVMIDELARPIHTDAGLSPMLAG